MTASIDYIKIIMKLASSMGINTDGIYRKANIDPVILKNPEARISLNQLNVVWDALEQKSTDENLGLHIGEKACKYPGHILFSVLFNSPDLSWAVKKFCRYYNLINATATPDFSVNHDIAILKLQFNTIDFRYSRHISEGIISFYYSLLSRLTEDRLRLKAVHFTHPSPDSVGEHKRIFKAPLLFGQNHNQLFFNREYLDLPVFLSNKDLLVTLENHAKNLQEKFFSPGIFSAKVQQLILEILPAERTDISFISKKLAISRRGLQNKLRDEGVTFQELLYKVRTKQAEYFLLKTDKAISEIAFLIGYTEQSSFNRAFKKTTGVTPGEYRKAGSVRS